MPGTVPEASPEPPAEGAREPLPETSEEIARETTVELRPERPGEQLPETAVVETPQISVEDVLEVRPYLRAEATGESTEEPEAEAATERVTDAVPESGADTAGERSEDVTAVVRPNSTQSAPISGRQAAVVQRGHYFALSLNDGSGAINGGIKPFDRQFCPRCSMRRTAGVVRDADLRLDRARASDC